MRIGMLVDRYKPYISGITNYISLSKAHLEQVGHEVFVFTFGDEDYPDSETNIIRSPGLRLSKSGYYINLAYRKQARRLLYTMDIAHVHHPFLSGPLGIRYCKPHGIPILFTNHTRYDLYSQAYLPGLPEAVSETGLRAYLPSFARACNLVIAPSKGMADVLVRLGVDAPTKIIPNGVDLEPFQTATDPMPREQLGVPSDALVLVYVGRLGPEKNLPFLLRSFAGAAQSYDHLYLVLVGSGPEKENLQHQALKSGLEGRVVFTGHVPYEKLPAYLAAGDVFVTASVTEVHPLSVIEALAAGKPVLGIASPGVSDTVENGVNGLLSSNDIAAFTAKMIRLCTDHELRNKISLAARDSAKTFDIKVTTAAMLEVYRDLVVQSASRKTNWRARLVRFIDYWN